MLLSLLSLPVLAAGPLPDLPRSACHTMALLPTALLAPVLLEDQRPPPPPDGKALRDVYSVPNQLESENFVLRWGAGVDAGHAAAALEAFERSWTVEITEMGHPVPPGADTHKFNVYVGSTGGGTPDIPDSTAGYFYTDSAGWPMIVLHPNVVRALDTNVTTIPHELYHAVQYAAGTYSYEGEGAWFWEATASWIETEVYPDQPEYAVFIGGYALLPHLQLDFFDYPDEGIIEEYHQYGAFVFPRYVAEFIGDWRIIRDAWVDPQVSGNKPLDAVAAEVEATGVPFEQAFMDFAARNVTWDYAHGDWYAYYVDYWVENFPQYDHRFAARFEGGGSDGEWSPDVEFAPRRYGVNTISLMEPEDGDLYIDFDGDESGSRGSAAAFGVTAVRVSGDEVAYDPLMLGDVGGELVVSDVGDLDAVHIVIGAWSEDLDWSEYFDYRIRLEVGPPRPDDPADTGDTGRGDDSPGPDVITRDLPLWTPGPASACGCASRTGTPAGGVALGLMAVVVGAVRRRRV